MAARSSVSLGSSTANRPPSAVRGAPSHGRTISVVNFENTMIKNCATTSPTTPPSGTSLLNSCNGTPNLLRNSHFSLGHAIGPTDRAQSATQLLIGRDNKNTRVRAYVERLN